MRETVCGALTGLAAVVALAACGNSPSRTPGPSAHETGDAATTAIATPSSAVAAAGAAAVVSVNPSTVANGGAYPVTVVNPAGRVTAHAVGHSWESPAPSLFVPLVSTSADRVYYEDGSGDVRWLSPSGGGGLATHLDVPDGALVAFSVSPDDRRIAVSVIRIGSPLATTTTRLFVQDLQGGGPSTTLAQLTGAGAASAPEWPVGWHGGALVVAVRALSSQVSGCGAMASLCAGGYRLMDATTGATTPVCPGAAAFLGPPVPAGVGCELTTGSVWAEWTGARHPFAAPDDTTVRISGCELAPDGSRLACVATPATAGSTAPPVAEVIAPNGTATSLGTASAVAGWVDASHVLIAGQGSALEVATVVRGGAAPVPVTSSPSAPVSGDVVAMLPGGL